MSKTKGLMIDVQKYKPHGNGAWFRYTYDFKKNL
jgi:hypothetical protein